MKMTWDDINICLDILSDKLEKIVFNKIVGISRGGLIPATLLSYRFNKPICSLQWQLRDLDKKRDYENLLKILRCSTNEGILIVDDLIDTGNTIKEIDKYIKELKTQYQYNWPKIYYCVCIIQTNFNQKYNETLLYGMVKNEEGWIDFPWDYIK